MGEEQGQSLGEEDYSAVRRHGVTAFAVTWMNLENTLMEKARHQRPCIISHSYEGPEGENPERESRFVVVRGWGWGDGMAVSGMGFLLGLIKKPWNYRVVTVAQLGEYPKNH